MIALYIILGVLLLLALILLTPVQVIASYHEDLTLTVKALCFKKQLLPSPEKRKKPDKKPKKPASGQEQPKKKPEEKKKQSVLSRLKEKRGLSGVVSLLVEVAEIAVGALKGVFAHIVIHQMDVGIALNTGDAASTAVAYGRLCAAVYPAVNIIAAATVCRNYNVTVEPVFTGEKQTVITAELYAHVRVAFLLWEGLKAGVKLIWLRIRV